MSAEHDREVAALTGQNERLTSTLRAAREQMEAMQSELHRLSAPPNLYGVFCERLDDESCVVFSGGKRMRVTAPKDALILAEPGQHVILNELSHVIELVGYEDRGTLVTVAQVMDDGRIIAESGADEQPSLLHRAGSLDGEPIETGDLVLADLKHGYAYEMVERDETLDLLLEEVPDISFEDIGGMAEQISQIQDAIELPYLYPDLFRLYNRQPPKGVLLYGPPGCGKTLIAKVVANNLAKKAKAEKAWFFNVKGPELLNKYVGESERHIRLIFSEARKKAVNGDPVIIFFDEMESMFRTRGMSISSDIESTVVPQLLAEMDGVEELDNVIVIGASNRQDLIDPAVLRPGRLDMKIQIPRPDVLAAREVFAKYLTEAVPMSGPVPADDLIFELIVSVTEYMFREEKETEFLEVTYSNGSKGTMYFKDFVSGAMIRNVVDRAKTMAIKAHIDGDESGVTIELLKRAVVEEYRETEDLPNTTSPDDWTRISGIKGEAVVSVRPLLRAPEVISSETVHHTGQYL